MPASPLDAPPRLVHAAHSCRSGREVGTGNSLRQGTQASLAETSSYAAWLSPPLHNTAAAP